MKAYMTNFDIHAVIAELTQRIGGSELKNIFELNDIFFFRFRTKKEGTLVLVVEPGKRIHITKFKRNFPPEPSGLCRVFRIHIKGKWLKSVSQYDFDRICVFEFEAHERVYTLIIELFGKGNLILLSPEKRILVAKHYKKMRDRDIHPGVDFAFPPSTGRNLLEADLDWVKSELKDKKDTDIVSALSRTVNINKDYSLELILRGKVDPKLKSSELSDEQLEGITKQIKKMRRTLSKGEFNPTTYRKPETNELVDITPFPMLKYKNETAIEQDVFSDALDEHFSTIESNKDSNVELTAEKRRVTQIVQVRRKQEEHLKSMKKIAEKEKAKGALMYLYLGEIDELLSTITTARHKNISWKEIKEKLDEAKKKEMKGARLLEKVQEKKKTVIVKLDGVKVVLDFLKTGSENASAMYKQAKKSESKIPGAQKKINELTERIKKLEEGYEELVQREKVMIEKRKKEWFEKFHWFKSSDGHLVIAGKDQRTNLELVKRYLDQDDLFLHAEIHGAAVIIIKGAGKIIPQSTIDEAATFSVCYSRAWKDGVSADDTFWVTPDQVTFSAPSGEYLAKGSFVIKGSKNILKNVPLELAVYPIVQEKNAFVICGPHSALLSREDIDKSKIIKVVPGGTIKSKMAKQIVEKFTKNVDFASKTKIKATALDELITILPGDSYIKTD